MGPMMGPMMRRLGGGGLAGGVQSSGVQSGGGQSGGRLSSSRCSMKREVYGLGGETMGRPWTGADGVGVSKGLEDAWE